MSRPCFVIGMAALLPFAACQKTSNTDTTSSDSESVSATPPPASEPVAAATPEPSPLAPPGVFFLLVATSVQTEDGIIGLPPGTRVLAQADGTYAAGEHRLTLRADQVTNNLRVAQHIAGADAAAQAALRRTSQAAAAAAAQRVPPATPKATPSQVSRSRGTSSAPARSASAPRSTALGQTGALGPQNSSTKDKVYTDSSGRRYWKDALGRERYDF